MSDDDTSVEATESSETDSTEPVEAAHELDPQREPEQGEPQEEPKKDEWETRYKELQRKFGEQGSELGSLRKEVSSFRDEIEKSKPKEASKESPWDSDPRLKNLGTEHRELLSAAFDAYLSQRGVNPNSFASTLQQLQTGVQQASQWSTQEALKQEIEGLKTRVGAEEWSKYVPKMQGYLRSHPDSVISYEDLFKVVRYDDVAGGLQGMLKQNKETRSARANLADTGKNTGRSSEGSSRLPENMAKMSNREAFRELLRMEGKI